MCVRLVSMRTLWRCGYSLRTLISFAVTSDERFRLLERKAEITLDPAWQRVAMDPEVCTLLGLISRFSSGILNENLVRSDTL